MFDNEIQPGSLWTNGKGGTFIVHNTVEDHPTTFKYGPWVICTDYTGQHTYHIKYAEFSRSYIFLAYNKQDYISHGVAR